jgi:hypothetical protein
MIQDTHAFQSFRERGDLNEDRVKIRSCQPDDVTATLNETSPADTCVCFDYCFIGYTYERQKCLVGLCMLFDAEDGGGVYLLPKRR